MKRIIAILLSMLFFMTGFTVSAAKAPVGYAKVPQATAYIDLARIECLEFNGYTFVVAEDLENYGFLVNWNADEKTLSLQYDPEKEYIEKDIQTDLDFGKSLYPVYKSEVKLKINGIETENFDLDGRILVNIDNLWPIGAVYWLSGINTIFVATHAFQEINNDWLNLLPPIYAGNNIVSSYISFLECWMHMLDTLKTIKFNYSNKVGYLLDKNDLALAKKLKSSIVSSITIIENKENFFLKSEMLTAYNEFLVAVNAYINTFEYLNTVTQFTANTQKLENLSKPGEYVIDIVSEGLFANAYQYLN